LKQRILIKYYFSFSKYSYYFASLATSLCAAFNAVIRIQPGMFV